MTELIIRALARIGFKQAIQNYCYQHQSKSYKDNLTYSFTDSKRQKYYFWKSLNDIPLCIMEKLTELQEQQKSKMPGADLDAWIEAVEKELNGDGQNKLTRFGYWLEMLKVRRQILFEPTVMMEICALLNVREDENPLVYNAELHKEKFEQITADAVKGGALYDFFQQAGLSSYVPSENITRENLQEYLTPIMEKVNDFNSALMRISTLGLKLEELKISFGKTE